MNKRNIWLASTISTFFVLMILAGSLLFLGDVMAAPPSTADVKIYKFQTSTQNLAYVSISALAFEPINQNAAYAKDIQRQFLSLSGQNLGNTIFIAPLLLRDRSELVGLTVFGEDHDSQGEVRLRLKRCDHSQPLCVTLAETNSTLNYAAGLFETVRVSVPNEVVDNRFYSYFLELELTALFNSGLRSVRLETIPQGIATSPVGDQEVWSLSGDIRSFPIPNLGLAQVRICTGDLSHLNNVTHNPFVAIDDDETISLASNNCITIWGTDIAIQRRPNTGPSSGTYQILR